MTKIYRISDISRLTNLSIPTLRYYEDLELLKPKRDLNNYRMFTEKDLTWITFIKRAKATGMSLSNIIKYSKLREKGDKTIIDRIDLLQHQENILKDEQKIIQEHIDFLQNKKQYYNRLLNEH
ncbi:MerR family transcriptional regulator [Leuconostoc fallax]|uniref:HTH merR-type domain-containing protein n=1 Tax=Leuconostoc fallax TaxID=1251 RepID=A0A4R5NA98_9LACO|nr:MerR family transcriptional regulator [Leuconostoc fallax]MBU7456422.1 MerR family transcriptional regulator [Leuconostoc fallax]MCO6183125.1 MerR family transcriptional regulator [Leuconostoc fallax]TDG69423.1 hypothetical protein C5L23_000885 [Leuconostoc fallax]